MSDTGGGRTTMTLPCLSAPSAPAAREELRSNLIAGYAGAGVSAMLRQPALGFVENLWWHGDDAGLFGNAIPDVFEKPKALSDRQGR